MAVGIAVMAANLSAAAWGTAAWARHTVSVWFWYLLRTAQVVVVIQVTLGLFLLIGQSKRADQGLHYLYGIAPLVVALVTEGMRADAARREIELSGIDDVESLERRDQVLLARRVVRREMGIMTIGAWLIVTLALRAFTTGG
jgi:ethanolamine transporter EutH